MPPDVTNSIRMQKTFFPWKTLAWPQKTSPKRRVGGSWPQALRLLAMNHLYAAFRARRGGALSLFFALISPLATLLVSGCVCCCCAVRTDSAARLRRRHHQAQRFQEPASSLRRHHAGPLSGQRNDAQGAHQGRLEPQLRRRRSGDRRASMDRFNPLRPRRQRGRRPRRRHREAAHAQAG